MDPSDFSSSFDSLALPEKPLAGDLPVDMEFGEDLLGSQTAPSQGWTPPGPPPTTEALDLLDTQAGLEKDPSVLDGATDLLGLGGLLYKAPSPPEVEHSPEGTLPWPSGDQPLESGPRGPAPEATTTDPGAGASPALTEGLLEPLAPESLINLEEETPSTTARRKGPSGQEEELLQGQPPSPNAPPSPSVGEAQGDGLGGSKTQPSPPAQPSLPGDGQTEKNIEQPPEKEQKRSERARRVEAPKPETVDSSEIPVSDEDSDAMVDDPNDEDFVPFRPRRSPRMSLRTNLAPRASRSAGTKMTCAHCRTPLQKGQTAYQRKGLPQLFCSSTCLTTFSKKPLGKKTCTFCKKEIWNTKDSVVAQTGSGGSFHEFCTSVCLSLYEAQQRPAPPAVDASDATRCSICQKSGEVLHEVSNGSVVHRLCSDSCFTKFRANKGLKTNCCDQCGAYIYSKGGGGAPPPELLFHEGQQKRFCSTACLGGYKKKNTRVYPCVWCKTLCKNFEMLSHVDRNGKTGLFCSLCCTTSHKVKQAGLAGPPRPCSFCRRSLSEPCYYNKTDRTVYQFCSPSCWTKFQRTNPEGGIHLSCHYCHSLFSGKPEILDWQDQVFQFCCRDCCEDFKRLRGVVSQCEHCRQEKLLHEKLRFSGVEKSFCSEGCVLLYKQDFTKKLGLCCITCTYCSQTCQRAVTEQLDGSTWDFCSEDCKSKYLLWYRKAARCHACKRQGKLLETIHWRGQIRHFCNQQCLLRFYSQQNQPNLDTQSGPESLLNSQSPEPKPSAPPQSKATSSSASAATAKSRPVPTDPTPPPPPPSMPRKNKAAMCKPLMQNRGVSCKVDMRSKGCQTEQDWKPQVIVLPVPVPIFVPVPMHLYSQKVPVPLSLPIPVPVPMFLPTTLESTDKIVETIEELKVKIPSNPLEADILAMAEMIAEAEELDKASSDLCDLVSNQSTEGLLEDCDLFGPARDDVLAMAVKMANVLDEPGQDLEADFPKNPLDINPSVDFLFDCGLVGPDDVSTDQDLPRAIRKGQKRLVLSESCSRDSMSSQPSCTALNYSYGVNAWKCWVQSKYAGGESSKSEELRFGPKPMRIKEDILACTAAELNYGLAQFVREITRPNGERYEPDSIYYLCLGIQQYLLENNRMVNIFTDLYYLTFVQELNKALSSWQPTILPNNTVFSRVEEEHLWECKQLGVYSPFVLLNTLMFFNTKFFGLQTAEEHMQLSFTNVVRQSRKCTTPRGTTKVVSIRYYAPARQRKSRVLRPQVEKPFPELTCTPSPDTSSGKRKREEELPVLEQRENRMNPLRCPVKFYEFYLSKCPESLRSRNDVFYLQPERSCIAESPLWYSVIPMDRSMLESMLNRILAVREIYEDPGRPGEEDLD
ncbi:zinc finger MYM-type protein 3 isoform X1 [Sarcophilus harrisii]|uniref:Zinc finger MYM-type containing 3 n=1 Tax=Sarcophilus harrisii TaxID=9305 RepID=G3W9G0_SARHA|nr:zinc finger MYM-type protein 3 isoform X1 [Sarcophilus harrisii]XP_031800421.1 zinc finger MYM-type protein 3 isoform X1 [Sarcophilus harrisii]